MVCALSVLVAGILFLVPVYRFGATQEALSSVWIYIPVAAIAVGVIGLASGVGPLSFGLGTLRSFLILAVLELAVAYTRQADLYVLSYTLPEPSRAANTNGVDILDESRSLSFRGELSLRFQAQSAEIKKTNFNLQKTVANFGVTLGNAAIWEDASLMIAVVEAPLHFSDEALSERKLLLRRVATRLRAHTGEVLVIIRTQGSVLAPALRQFFRGSGVQLDPSAGFLGDLYSALFVFQHQSQILVGTRGIGELSWQPRPCDIRTWSAASDTAPVSERPAEDICVHFLRSVRTAISGGEETPPL